jgi:hypothetical protein
MHDRNLGLRLSELWTIASSLPMKRRKQIVLLCRAQEVVFDDPYNLLAIQTGLTSSLDDRSLNAEEKRYYHLVSSYQDLIRSTVFSSVVLDICRSAPLSSSEISEIKLASWGKEVAVCERQERDLHFNYDCWFSQDDYTKPLISGVPANPKMACRIHSALINWKRVICASTLYPRMSRKSVSKATVRDWESIKGRSWGTDEDGGVQMTQESIERIHHREGLVLGGCSEIRQVWTKSQMGPRTYFASGGYAYEKSKHIQEIAGRLTEQLDATHPIMRLNPARIRLKDNNYYLRIYDLSTFTSNHWECKHFLDRLANWCCDDITTIIDPLEGAVQVSLGELISDYNHSMNYCAEYSLERIGEEFLDMCEFHNQAGFLGIYGNINFSTFVHGASLLMTVEDEDNANVAGDDGHYAEQYGCEWITDRVILANGVFETSKSFRGDEIGAVCLKRGLNQIEGRVYPKRMLIFPSFSNLGALFKYASPQFSKGHSNDKHPLDLVGTEVFRFLRGLFLSGVNEDLDPTLDLLEAIYTCAHLPKYGELPPYGNRLIPALPDASASLILIPPLDLLLHYHFSSGAILPKVLYNDSDDGSFGADWVAGNQWEGTMTRKIRYLDVLGYVRCEKQSEVVWGIDAYNRLVDMYSGSESYVYNICVLEDVPVHLAEIVD